MVRVCAAGRTSSPVTDTAAGEEAGEIDGRAMQITQNKQTLLVIRHIQFSLSGSITNQWHTEICYIGSTNTVSHTCL